MLKASQRIALLLCLPLFSVVSLRAHSEPFDDRLLARMTESAPRLDHEVLSMAVSASRCAVGSGVAMPKRLAVIDFSLPSSEERMWIFDVRTGDLILRDLVAHGRKSGNFRSTAFSNAEGSNMSSIGLFRGSESYYGKHGYSLRLDGLEPGVNDLARQRAIVIHGADYVSDSWVDQYGRIGRSLGCPAVDNQVIEEVVDSLKGGQLVFKYYPDQEWLQSSSFLHCDDTQMAAAAGNEAGRS